ncbi:MAG TPA: hypothetical protein VGG38_04685 [Acidimicrobiales bacterium]
MPLAPRPNLSPSPLRAALPQILIKLGVAFMILGLIITIGFVAGDTTCNAATNLSNPVGAAGSSFCGHADGFEALGFIILVLGAGMLVFGSMILPTLRTRDARIAAATRAAEVVEPNTDQVAGSELETVNELGRLDDAPNRENEALHPD